MTRDKVAPYGEEPVEIVINDQVFYQAGGMDLSQMMEERKETRIKNIKGKIIP